MKKIKEYIESNSDRFLEELFGLIRIPSISSESAHKPDMVKAAEYWRDSLLKAGADKAEVMPTDGNPIVYGEKIIDPKKPTVLVYGPDFDNEAPYSPSPIFRASSSGLRASC